MDKTYSVYRHICPTGEVYVGITAGSVEDRWDNGFGYESQRKFFKRIVAIGWDNIRHEIVKTNLDEKMARKMERELIAQAQNKTLNTQHRTPLDTGWLRKPITNDSTIDRRLKFMGVSDGWLDKVRYEDTVPFDWVISDNHIDFKYLIDDGNARLYVLRVPIPAGVTYSGLYHYLYWELDFGKAAAIESIQAIDISQALNRRQKEVAV
jgi:hypothetical protein